MQKHLAAIGVAALSCCALAVPADAGPYNIDLSLLAPDAGKTLDDFTIDGFTFDGGFLVIGPNSPDYEGRIGIEPTSGGFAIFAPPGVAIQDVPGPGLTMVLAPVDASTDYYLSLAGLNAAGGWSDIPLHGTLIGDPVVSLPTGLSPVTTLIVEPVATEPYQVLALNVLPEPSGFAMGGIAVGVAALAGALRRRSRQVPRPSARTAL
jgi:hypothetical protein